MATSRLLQLFLLSLLSLSLHRPVLSNQEEEMLLQGINDYRTSRKLTTLLENENAACVAEEIADLLKHQPCTASVPESLPAFPGFVEILTNCEVSVTSTRDGAIMPACVPDLEPSRVLSSYTKSRYSKNLNDSKFTGIGIASDHDWIVVILTTSTPEGGYTLAPEEGEEPETDSAFTLGVNRVMASCLLVLLFSFFMF